MLRIIQMLVFFTLGSTTLCAQKTIAKPQRKTTTTATTTQKPRTNKNAGANTSTQSSSSTKVSEPTGYINGHGYVDLGLSIKWATCNVGASSPLDYGNYYAWGETSAKSSYTEENSKTYGMSMGSIAGNSQYDAARANWGGTWRLPTADEMDELVGRCTWKWTTQGGHNGYKVTGSNGNSIFLPSAGWREEASFNDVGKYGIYWSATLYQDGENSAYALCFRNDYHNRLWGYCYFGQAVRPVSE